jgi:hypothetical protein
VCMLLSADRSRLARWFIARLSDVRRREMTSVMSSDINSWYERKHVRGGLASAGDWLEPTAYERERLGQILARKREQRG